MNFQQIVSTRIAWRDAARDQDLATFLADLQANILKGHGRHHAAHIFLSFGNLPKAEVAGIVRGFGAKCTSAIEQLSNNRKEPPHLDGGPVRCFFLTAHGYGRLGDLAVVPDGEAFQQGMAERQGILADPPRADWDVSGWVAGNPRVDAMFLTANASPDIVDADVSAVISWLNGSGVRVLVVEKGLQQTRRFDNAPQHEGVEHFGYVDGRSQPLFLQEDFDEEARAVWKQDFRPQQFIVPDPNGGDLSGGSYFVFRKLEQNVFGFKRAEEDLGKKILPDTIPEMAGKTPAQRAEAREIAGAMVVGRFENGTPLISSPQSVPGAPPNDFNYDADENAVRCPFHAHIRKTNPRGDVQREFNVEGDAGPIMARRGITYGQRQRTADGDDFADKGREPRKDVGLLFMAYMESIEKQFEFTQQSWANNVDFLRSGTGVDPVIGQGGASGARSLHYQADPNVYPHAPPVVFDFGQFVTMKGGEYFFAPSLSFMRGVGL